MNNYIIKYLWTILKSKSVIIPNKTSYITSVYVFVYIVYMYFIINGFKKKKIKFFKMYYP